MITFHSDLTQNTPEWFEFRRQHITASDVPAIMGESPYKSPRMIFYDKMNPVPEQMTLAQSLGHKYEPIARDIFENRMGEKFPPAIVSDGILSASLDGYNGKDAIVEIKYQGKENHNRLIDEKYIPHHYMLQMQTQLLVTGLSKCYFVSYNPDCEVPLEQTLVTPIASMQRQIKQAVHEFQILIEANSPPERTELDAVDIELELPELNELVSDYVELATRQKAITERMDEIRKQMQDTLDAKDIQFAKHKYLTMHKVTKKGSVDYKMIPGLAAIDLNEYRKPATSFWQLRVK